MKSIFLTTAILLCFVLQSRSQGRIDPQVFPYAYVVKLKTYSMGSKSYNHGTGVVINRNSIITNAHNVFGKDSIIIISGYGGKDSTKIHSVSVSVKKDKNAFYPSEYDENENQFDYAVVKYADEQFFDNIFRQSSNRQLELQKLNFADLDTIHIAGYPYYRWFERFIKDRTKGELQIANATDKKEILDDNIVLQYKLGTRKGSSGSPLWVVRDGKCILTGIHRSGFGSSNAGILYNLDAIAQINKWMSIQ